MSLPDTPKTDVQEHGANQQVSDRRLFMQLHVFGGCLDAKAPLRALESSRVEAVLYQDANDPRGIAVLAMSEDPTFFVSSLRELLNAEPFAALAPKPALTMFGRTYASGFEADLDEWLLRRPRRTALNPAWPWAIWYPLRRTGGFSRLTPQEQGAIIREHSVLGQPAAPALVHPTERRHGPGVPPVGQPAIQRRRVVLAVHARHETVVLGLGLRHGRVPGSVGRHAVEIHVDRVRARLAVRELRHHPFLLGREVGAGAAADHDDHEGQKQRPTPGSGAPREHHAARRRRQRCGLCQSAWPTKNGPSVWRYCEVCIVFRMACTRWDSGWSSRPTRPMTKSLSWRSRP